MVEILIDLSQLLNLSLVDLDQHEKRCNT